MFSFHPYDRVLDVGCGDGINVKVLRDMGISRVVGVDVSPFLIKKAKKMNPKVKFYIAPAEKLPFRVNQFDAVLVDSVFHHLFGYEKPLKEIRRVLKPGGKLCFIEPRNTILRRFIDFISLTPIAPAIPIIKERSQAYRKAKDRMQHWLATQEEFFMWLNKLDMKEVFCHADFMSIIGKFEKCG